MPLEIGKVKSGVVTGLNADAFAGWLLHAAARVPPVSTRPGLQAILFDLDGVLVDTARFHYLAWKKLADELGVEFNEHINHGFRGVGRMACLDMLLGDHGRFFAAEEKTLLAERKNGYYLEMVQQLGTTDLADGARELARELHAAGVRMALVSASCNARLVLRLLGITEWFDAIVDGTELRTKTLGFLRAAERLRVLHERCIVIEDAEAGVNGAKAAGMKVVGLGDSAHGADVVLTNLRDVRLESLEKMLRPASSRPAER